MKREPNRLDGKLEPEAAEGMSSPSEAALFSMAVSMKRIADVIERSRDLSPLRNQLDGIAWEVGQTLGRAFEIGSRRS